ncbi:Wnt-9a-like [Homarus americanus]|uniref:Protein Wnt n=1 Tax=Homarus americanus TaxID=6706 RepID=A0A8J5JVR9_HOMAM|nr:Wnt-9a-like [Homarus americanus]
MVVKFNTVLALIVLLSVRHCLGYCGVSSRRKVDKSLLASSVTSLNLSYVDLRTLCERVGVEGWGRRECGRSVEVAEVIVEAAWLGATHCQDLMTYNRWNCSLGRSRRKIMRKAMQETAFLEALSSASVAHVVSRACARGRLTPCSCLSSLHSTPDTLKAWRWGGCGDDLKYGRKYVSVCLCGAGAHRFAEKLFQGKRRRHSRRQSRSGSGIPSNSSSRRGPQRSRDFKSQIDAHNACVGIVTVMKGSQQTCKCHGVSGSCTMKTCWMQLPSFAASTRIMNRPRARRQRKMGRFTRTVGDDDGQVSGTIHSNPGGLTPWELQMPLQDHRMEREDFRLIGDTSSKHHNKRIPRSFGNTAHRPSQRNEKRSQLFKRPCRSPLGDPTKLIYLDSSPNYCHKNKHGPGTSGRACKKRENCDMLCCGRGYDTTVSVLWEPCRCRVKWCCEVLCHNCSRTTEIYTCK